MRDIKQDINLYLINIFFVLVFIPYISFLPLNTDIQPLFAIVGWFIILLNRKILLTRFEIIFFLFAIFMLGNIYLESPPDFLSILRKNSALLLVFPVIFLTRKYIYSINSNLLTYIIYIYAGSILVELFLPNIYYNILGHFFTHKVIEIGTRGVSGLMAEPTDFGFTSFMLLVINYLFYNLRLINKKKYTINSILLIIMILSSISASGFISLLLFYILLFINNNKIISILIIFIMFLIYYYLSSFLELINNRVLYIVINLITNPFTIIENTSLFYRIFYDHLAILNLYDSFGLKYYGLGCTKDLIPYLIHKYHFYNIYSNRIDFFYYLESINYGYGTKNIFAQLLINFGLLGFIILLYFYIKIFLNIKGVIKWVVLLSITLCIIQSFPLIYPLLWVIISISLNFNNIKRRIQYEN